MAGFDDITVTRSDGRLRELRTRLASNSEDGE